MARFEDIFRTWVQFACNEWEYPFPDDEYFRNALSRLSVGIGDILAHGVASGIVIEKGKQFILAGLPPHKGPYSWFSRSRGKYPAPNWEYYVQAAEYIRLYERTRQHADLTLTFEDDLMDLAVYESGTLLVCCEVKEKSSQLMRLIAGIKQHQDFIDYSLPDRGNDPLRKAKYIAKRRPQYFYGVAIGRKVEFSVDYPEGMAFRLKESLVPLV